MDNGQTPGGNTTTAGAVEQLEMARRIVARFYRGIRDHDYAQWVLEGHKDETTGVKIALAAIIETTEAAAKYAANLEPIGDAADEPEYFHGHCDGTNNVAIHLRDFRHLKGPQP